MDAAKLIDELVRDESDKAKPYFDCGHTAVLTCPQCISAHAQRPGILTAGIGRNLRDVGLFPDERFRMCHNDIERVCAELDQFLPWWRQLNEARQRVLANMCFNLGIHELLAFRATLALIKSGAFEQAGNHMLSLPWAKQVGPRAFRLSQAMIVGVL